MYEGLFNEYEGLSQRAASAFESVSLQFKDEVRCRKGCADCCHAAFGLFLVEAAYMRWRFSALDRKLRRSVLNRCDKARRERERALSKDRMGGSAPEFDLSRVRLRCPLLSDDLSCDLYRARPITCMVYGIPTRSAEGSMVCPRSGFERGGSYPAFDLGAAQERLYALSIKLLGPDPAAPEKARLLLSVDKALTTPLDDLLAGRI